MTHILSSIFYSINFFSDIGEVVSVRLIVNPEGKHVSYSFVEFASSYEANKVRLVFVVMLTKVLSYLKISVYL